MAWFNLLSDSTRFCFCRITQIGFLRLLTTEQIMTVREVLTQQQAWQVYDDLQDDDRLLFMEEPANMEVSFRAASQMNRAAPKDGGSLFDRFRAICRIPTGNI